MKGVVLAGGTGSRLRPITHTTPKQLVPLGSKSVLEHVIEDLKQAGVREIGIVIGDNFPEQIQRTLGDGSQYGVDITYIFQGKPLGLAHAVACARDFVGTDSFVVYFGDTLLDQSITAELVETFDPAVDNVGFPVQAVEYPSRFGVVEFDENSDVARVHEKPDDPPSEFAYVGVVAFTPAFFDVVEGLDPSDRGELELTDAIDQLLVNGQSSSVFETDDTWKDVGTPADVVEANEIVLSQLQPDVAGCVSDGATIEGAISLGTDAVVEAGATIKGPVVIGEGTTIESGSNIGPSVTIGRNCSIRVTSLSSSVIGDDVDIELDASITDSVVGSRTTLAGGAGDEPLQCVLGRDASFKI